MTVTAHLEHEPPAPSPPAGPGTPVFEVGDLVEDPRTDVEALCLCALLWAPAPAVATVTELLQAADFYDPPTGTCSPLWPCRCTLVDRTIPPASPLP